MYFKCFFYICIWTIVCNKEFISISMYDWEKPLNVLMKKVYNYASLHSNVDDIFTATALVDLCRDSDNHRFDVFTHSDIIDIIQMLCTC